jgi:hypothetical protein
VLIRVHGFINHKGHKGHEEDSLRGIEVIANVMDENEKTGNSVCGSGVELTGIVFFVFLMSLVVKTFCYKVGRSVCQMVACSNMRAARSSFSSSSADAWSCRPMGRFC